MNIYTSFGISALAPVDRSDHLILSLPGLVHHNPAPAKFGVVHRRHHSIGIRILHFHETKASRPACVSVGDNSTRYDIAMLAKNCRQISLRCFPRKVADI